ncbi:hypothetical protein GIB67_014336 [Kingdonia uniflora]|uniref:Uncharacterized protein n=1 Tax=Kingdonia uniflora TaxID=39325 RepID=A0A7J7NT96_9MAGN|nr:hypothetical protein GIB67_014336 [Kingdonia uniflora]
MVCSRVGILMFEMLSWKPPFIGNPQKIKKLVPLKPVCHRASTLAELILVVPQDGSGSFQAHRFVKTHVSKLQVRVPAPLCIDGVSLEDHIQMAEVQSAAFVEGSAETENGYASV